MGVDVANRKIATHDCGGLILILQKFYYLYNVKDDKAKVYI